MATPEDPAARFRELDPYRVDREWSRYEGTPQRELFRELRRRFLRRHGGAPGWALDLGSGPGRFSDDLGPARAPRVLLDLSDLALRAARDRERKVRRSRTPWGYVRGDARRPPFRDGSAGTVVVLGNVLGFSGDDAMDLLGTAARLAGPDGVLILEAVAGPGERARYLRRLPPGAVRRAVRSPTAWLRRRIDAEGFVDEPARKAEPGSAFARLDPPELVERLARLGFGVAELEAIAPALGSDPERIAAVRTDAAAWTGLLELEELLGRTPERLARAAAYLVAARRGLETAPPAAAPSAEGATRSRRGGVRAPARRPHSH